MAIVLTCWRCGEQHRGRRQVDCYGNVQDLVGAAKSAYDNDPAVTPAKGGG